MSILASILVYASAGGQLAYIDALFLASGSNTQAGLNTVDINLLNTFQQFVLYLFSMFSSPITIHSSVVFLRLYWFEKRFQNVVKEARSRRVTLSKSKSKAQPTAADIETGVNGRSIRVMHDTAVATGVNNEGAIALHEYMADAKITKDLSATGSELTEHEQDSRQSSDRQPRPTSPTITFADKVKRSDRSSFDDHHGNGDDASPPAWHSNAEHIAVLERQRKVDSSVLRIPGPRDVERGVKPEELAHDDRGVPGRPSYLTRQRTRDTAEHNPEQPRVLSSHGDRQQTITIAEPVRPSRHEHKFDGIAEDAEAVAHTLSPLKYRRSRGRGPEGLQRVTSRGTSSSATHNPLHRIRTALTFSKDEPMPYLSWQPTIGRNSQFVGLSEEQREELGGIEYRSLKTLAILLLVYFWGFTIFSIITMVPWIVNDNETWGPVIDAAGQSRTWWGFFTAGSALMDLGFTLTPDSMISFNTATFPLLVMSFLIIAGNTGFPILLRFMIWITSLFVPRGTALWEELKFLLDHPRRCFTMLFPANATWWLFFILVVLNGLDLILFIVLDVRAALWTVDCHRDFMLTNRHSLIPRS